MKTRFGPLASVSPSQVLLATTFLAASVLAIGSANADDNERHDNSHFHSILSSCNMSFHASGKSIYLGIGYTDVSGEGLLSCYDLAHGTTQHIPLKVTARGPGAGLGVTGLVLSGGATGIGIATGPEALLGHYVLARANAAAGVGGAAGLGFRLSNGSATIDVAIQAQTGLGAGVDLLWVNIEAAEHKEDSHRDVRLGEGREDSRRGGRLAESRDDSHRDGRLAESEIRDGRANENREDSRRDGRLGESRDEARRDGRLADGSAQASMPARVVPSNSRRDNIPTSHVTIRDGEPISVVDSSGRLLQLIYVNRP